MKQSILLMSACLLAGFTQAQESNINSLLFGNRQFSQPHAAPGQVLSVDQMNRMHQNYLTMVENNRKAAAKTTSTTITDWYNLFNQNYNTSGSNTPVDFYWPVFPDSNLYDATNSSHVFTHMMGMSFDPTDSSYYDSTVNFSCLVGAVSQPMALTGQSYTIDSFFAEVTYVRNDASTTDSLILEFSVAIPPVTSGMDTGTYNVSYAYQSYLTGYASDGKPRFATEHYNPGLASQVAPYNAAPYINDAFFDSVLTSAAVPQTAYHQRIAIALKTGTDADTTNGVLNLGHLLGGPAGLLAIGLPHPALLTSKEHMVSTVSFKSGHMPGNTYPLGTALTAANYIKLYAGSPRSTGGTAPTALAFTQGSSNTAFNYPGSFQEGLNINNQSRYDATVSLFGSGAVHDELIGAAAYGSSTGTYYDFTVTNESYHIYWTANPPLGIKNINNSLDNIKAYPNPATNTLNITYTSSTAVTVTLTNMVGQVVATQNATNGKAVFNTTELPSGVYIYTLSANGEHTTGRVVIAH